MAAWETYKQESVEYKDVDDIKLDNHNALLIAKKLIKHFKVDWVWVNKKPCRKFILTNNMKISFNRRTTSMAFTRSGRIEFRNNPDMNTVAHEVAHHLADKKYETYCHHNKKYKREMKRICKYIRKKNYFGLKSINCVQNTSNFSI